MDTSKIIKGVVNSGRYTVTAPIIKEDYGLYLQIEGVELPQTYEVDFSNSEHSGTSVTMIGNSDGVLIPHQFIDTGKDVFAFLYHVGANYGRTVYKFRIPNKCRPDRTDDTPTPEEQSVIDQAISALNTAVAKTAQDVISADQSAQSAKEDADRAEQARDDAQTYANNAQTSANNASASASQASTSATASAQSASQSAQIKDDVEGMVDDAQGYAQASAQSASASANSASQAQGFAQSASASANSASGYASQADISANTASNKASEASTSASTASQKATESAQSASQALSYKTDAESAKTASQTAQGLAESARDTAVSAKTDAESARDDAVQAKEDAESAVASISGALIEKAPIITDTASGAIASFSDGANDLPLKSLVVDINPVQDLHGQENPYPAGGGKNLFDKTATDTSNGYIARTYINDGGTSSTGNYNVSEYIRIKGSTTYTLNPTKGSNPGYCFYDSSKNVISGAKYLESATVTFTSPSNAAYLRFSIPKANIDVIQLEEGSTATSYAPYENLCPISGWTEVHPTISGINVWDGYVEDGALRESNGEEYPATLNKRSGWISVSGGASYYFRRVDSTIGTGRFFFYDANKQFLSSIMHVRNNSFTTPSNASYMRLLFTNLTLVENDISINYPSTDHSYHPYTGRSININLGQTVYGGKLNVLTGELAIDMAMVDLGTLDWNYSSINVWFYNYAIGVKSSTKNAISSVYTWRSSTDILSDMTLDKVFTINNTSACFRDLAYTDVSAFKAAMNGVQLCYELATPIEIQLSANQINSLYGVNNLWADSGDTTAEYRADTKLYIAKKIAEAISALS